MPIVAGNYHAGVPVREQKKEVQKTIVKVKCVSPCSVRLGDASFSYLQDLEVGKVYGLQLDPVAFELIRSSVELVEDAPVKQEPVAVKEQEVVPVAVQEEVKEPASMSGIVSSDAAVEKAADDQKQPKRSKSKKQ